MEQIIEILRKIFSILLFCGCIIPLFQGIKAAKTGSNSSVTSHRMSREDKLAIIYNLISSVAFVGLVCYFAFVRRIEWLLLVFIIPALTHYASSILFSANIVGNIVRNPNEKKLSLNERTAIIVFAGMFWLTQYSKEGDWLIEGIASIKSNNIHDMCIFFRCAWHLYFLTFLNSALLSIPVQLLLDLIKTLETKLHIPWKNLMTYFYTKSEANKENPYYITQYIAFAQKKRKVIRRFLYIICPLIIIADLVENTVEFFFSMLFSALFNLSYILRSICRAMVKPLKIWGAKNDRQIIAIAFRIAIITTLSLIVVLNRINPMFRNQESSTAILEFAASSIIIPIVFEWINSIHSKK